MALPAKTRRTASLWHNRSFLLFWGGETCSLFGTQITVLALPLTAILVLHVSAPQLGLLRFLESVPYVLCTLVFGAWVDRRRRRPLLMLANAARSVLIGAVPVLALLHQVHLFSLALIAFGMGICTVLFDVTWLAYLPALIYRQDVVEANGKVTMSLATAEVVGPGLGGILIQLITAPFAMIIDAGSYIVATLTLMGIRDVEPEPRQPLAQHPHLGREIREGWNVVFDHPALRAIMVMSGLWNFLDLIAETLFLLYAIHTLHFQPGTLGAILAIGAVGGLLGTALSTALGRHGTFGPVLGIAFTCGCLPWFLLPTAPGATGLAFVLCSLAFFVIRFGLGLWSVLTLSLRQAVTPPHLLGRVSATMRMVSFGLGALGVLCSGFLGAWLGLRVTLWAAALGFVVILLVTLLATPLPHIRALPQMAEEE